MRLPSSYGMISLFLFAAFAVYAVNATAEKPSGGDPHAPRWEHLALTHQGPDVQKERELSQQINRLGDEGWQLVSVSTTTKDGTTVSTVFYFKRPK